MDTNLRLLVIDDEEMMLSLFEAVMAEYGYAIATASSGREGIEMVRHGRFDVVISDIKMPDMTGIDVLEAVRRISSDTGVVLITGYASLETAVDAIRLGADAYLFKPFEDFERDVLKPIERIAQRYALRRENERLAAALNEANEHLKRANHEYRRTLAHLTTQQQLSSMLCGAPDLESIAAIVEQALTSGFETYAGALFVAQHGGRFELISGSGALPRPVAPVVITLGSGPVGAALQQRRPTPIEPSTLSSTAREPWMPADAAALVVPCVATGATVGALVVFDPDPARLFDPDTVSLYSVLAAQIGAPLALARAGGVGAPS
jgi:CheY-like chemotaxis protein